MALLNGLVTVNFLSHLSDAQAVSNTFHLSNQGAGSPPDEAHLEALASQLHDQFAVTYRALHVVSSVWDTITCTQVSDGLANDVLLQATFAVAQQGTRTESGTYVPNGLCGVASLKTPNASRRFRGHLMLPPCRTAGSVDGNALNPTNAYYTAAAAFAAEMAKGSPTGAGWTGSELGDYFLAIFSKTAALNGDPAVANVQTVIIRPKASFLRRRERGSS
jgi:hypothetical protein